MPVVRVSTIKKRSGGKADDRLASAECLWRGCAVFGAPVKSSFLSHRLMRGGRGARCG